MKEGHQKSETVIFVVKKDHVSPVFSIGERLCLCALSVPSFLTKHKDAKSRFLCGANLRPLPLLDCMQSLMLLRSQDKYRFGSC